MLLFKPGSHLHWLLTALAVTGEIPVSALHLFGNRRSMRDLITKLTLVQDYRNSENGDTLRCQLLTLIGKGESKSVRLLRSGLPMLDWIGAREYHEAAFWTHNFQSDLTHREPLFRFAEAALMFLRAGAEIRPWVTPSLENARLLPETPFLYSSRELKKLRNGELKKVQYARVVGAVFAQSTAISVFNTRNAIMKWNGMGEFKARLNLRDIAKQNTAASKIDTAILFGNSTEIAVRTVDAVRKDRQLELRFDGVYFHICFVPLTEEGVDQLRLLLTPDWNERLLSALFEPAQRSYNHGAFEYDGVVAGTYVFCFFDGDIARLIRLQETLAKEHHPCQLVCFPFQVGLAKQVLGELVDIRIIEPGDVLNALGVERRTIFES